MDKIGYSEKTIRWHINKGRIFTILQDRKFLVSKFSLIKFIASGKGFAMQPKSEWHEKAIRWFIKEMYNELLWLLKKDVGCDIINSPINKNLTR